MGQLLPTITSDPWYKLLIKLEIIDLLFTNDLNEVMLEAFNHPQLELTTKLDFELFIHSLMFHYSLECNYLNPFVSEIIEFNQTTYRISLIHSSLNFKKNFKLYLRKMTRLNLPLNAFTTNDHWIKSLEQLVNQQENILITGASGSGKTTLLKTLLTNLPSHDHTVILEDLPELHNSHLNSNQISHFVTRESFKQNSTQIEINQLCSYILRINPSRLIVGEIRSSEISGLLLCMNCGVKGVMSTLHASSAHEAFNRLSLLYTLYHDQKGMDYAVVLKLLATHFKYVVHVENRQIKEFIKIYSVDETNIIFDEV